MIHYVILLAFLAAPGTPRDTKLVMALHRHGARHSYGPLEKPEEVGLLTQNGQRMTYLLGRYLRQRFPDFFPQRMSSNDTFVYSSALTRCRRSALGVLTGIYDHGSLNDTFAAKPPFASPEWEGLDVPIDFPFPLPAAQQPVPVHSFLEPENHVFQPDRADLCPRVRQTLATEVPAEVAPILAAINAFLPKLINPVFDYRTIVNKDVFTSLKDFTFPDYYHSQRFLGNHLGLSDDDYLRFERLDAFVGFHEVFRIPDISKYLFTELSRLMIARLEDLQRDLALTPDLRRFILLSGHDTNVYAALLAAQLVKLDCLTDHGECTVNPRYASSLLFEVYHDHDRDQHLVESALNGDRIPFCPSPDGADCTLAQFIDRLKAVTFAGDIDALRDRFCRLPPDNKTPRLLTLTAFLLSAALACGGLALFASRKPPTD